jgi:hypothetical protein
MPQYIMLVNFTDQGLKGVKDVPNRQDKSRETAKQFEVERKTVWMACTRFRRHRVRCFDGQPTTSILALEGSLRRRMPTQQFVFFRERNSPLPGR